jgi:hypothetical protein
MGKKPEQTSSIIITVGIPKTITYKYRNYKPTPYCSYEQQRDDYLTEIQKAAGLTSQTVDISFLKGLLEIAQIAFECICDLPQDQEQRETFRLKADLYGSLAADLKHIVHSSQHTIYHTNNLLCKDTLQDDVKGLYTLLLMLYVKAIVELEKILSSENKYFNIHYHRNLYTDHISEEHFARCLEHVLKINNCSMSIDTANIFSWLREKISHLQV